MKQLILPTKIKPTGMQYILRTTYHTILNSNSYRAKFCFDLCINLQTNQYHFVRYTREQRYIILYNQGIQSLYIFFKLVLLLLLHTIYTHIYIQIFLIHFQKNQNIFFL